MAQCKKIVPRVGSFAGSQCRKEPVAGSEYCVQHDPACRAKAKEKRGPSLFERQQEFLKAFTVYLYSTFPAEQANMILRAAEISFGSPGKDQIPDPMEFLYGS